MGQVFPFHWMPKSAKAFGFRGPLTRGSALDPAGGTAARPPLQACATALTMYLSRPTFHYVPTSNAYACYTVVYISRGKI